MRIKILHAAALISLFILNAQTGTTQTVLLYKNSFESPLIPPAANCGPDLDATLVNTLWGGTGLGTGGGGQFQQINTVETILIHGPYLQYTDASGLGGNYCLSMLSAFEDDKAALTLNSEMLPFANITFLLSAIDIAGCGGPFGLDTPVMRMTVYDSPGGTFDFYIPGTMLDETIITGGPPNANSYSFNWILCTTSLDISESVDGNITIVFDLLESGYAAIDSIEISSSITAIAVEDEGELKYTLLSPNPFSDEIVISGTAAMGEIILFDIAGKEIIRQKSFENLTEIDVKDLLPGIYMMNYLEENAISGFKLIKF
ncbi:MAG: T9SS type A sorting domain-containing protein [Chitinophagales bacterium]